MYKIKMLACSFFLLDLDLAFLKRTRTRTGTWTCPLKVDSDLRIVDLDLAVAGLVTSLNGSYKQLDKTNIILPHTQPLHDCQQSFNFEVDILHRSAGMCLRTPWSRPRPRPDHRIKATYAYKILHD